jgi:hypothetical protein
MVSEDDHSTLRKSESSKGREKGMKRKGKDLKT